MADLEQKPNPEPISRLGFTQFRQAFQNVGMKVIKGAFQSLNFISNIAGWKISNDTVEFNVGTFKLGGTLITISDISLLQDTITLVGGLGGGTVALSPGTYNATSSFLIPSGVTFDGNGSTIDFGGGAYQFLIQGSSAYSTGTLSVNFNSGSVTGSGTTWTAGMVGQSILIGDYWYIITARASNTAITISPTFNAPSVSGATYVIATTVEGVSVLNTTLNNSSGTLLKYRYVQGLNLDGLVVSNGGQGIDGDDSNGVQWLNFQVDTCTVGVTFDNVPFSTINNGGILNITGGTGLALTGVSNTSVGILAIQKITGVGIKFTTCYNLGLLNYSIIECTSQGIEFVSGNSDVAIIDGYINTCGGDGIKLTASSNRIEISTTNLLNSTGYGINIANANCNNNIISANTFSNNTAGAVNDSGTGTQIRGNQGVSDNNLSIKYQKLSYIQTSDVNYSIQQSTSDNDGTCIYVSSISSPASHINIVRYQRDAFTGQYWQTHTVDFSAIGGGGTSISQFSVCVDSTYLYVIRKDDAANKLITRFLKADLSVQTSITISGTSFADGRASFCDGSNLYVYESSGTFRKFSISGTIVTNVSTISFTATGVVFGAICDGTYAYMIDAAANPIVFRKYALTGGAVISSISRTYPKISDNGNPVICILQSTAIGLLIAHSEFNATTRIGISIEVLPIPVP